MDILCVIVIHKVNVLGKWILSALHPPKPPPCDSSPVYKYSVLISQTKGSPAESHKICTPIPEIMFRDNYDQL